MRLNRWLVYWGDGTTWHGDPFRPPKRVDCQVIAIERNNEKKFGLIHHKEYYVWKDDKNGGQWYGVDEGGYWDYVLTYLGPQSILNGRTMAFDDDFWAIVSRAGKEGLA